MVTTDLMKVPANPGIFRNLAQQWLPNGRVWCLDPWVRNVIDGYVIVVGG